MKLDVQENHLGGKIFYRSAAPLAITISYNYHTVHVPKVEHFFV